MGRRRGPDAGAILVLEHDGQDDDGGGSEEGPGEEGDLAGAGAGVGAGRDGGVVDGGVLLLGGAVRLLRGARGRAAG